MSSSRKFCVNDPNNFAIYVVNIVNNYNEEILTDFVKQAYEEYFFQIYNRLNQSVEI
jgi:hypothetical protein